MSDDEQPAHDGHAKMTLPTEAHDATGSTAAQELLAFLATAPLIEREADEVIVRHGAGEAMIGVVEAGLVKGVLRPRYGPIRAANLAVVGDGHWFGLECLAEGLNIEWRCMTECRVRVFTWPGSTASLPRGVLAALLEESAWVLNRTLHLNYIGRLPLDQRVLSRLCDLREACSLPEVRITHEDLASLVGVHRNKIGVSLKRLAHQGLLSTGYGEIRLGSLEDLEAAYQQLAREAQGDGES